jgi:hypothetical protein
MFVAGMLVLGVCVEMWVRNNELLFESATHRALAKAAICDRHPRVDFLLFGTSRTQDGVSPNLISRALAEADSEMGSQRGYNAAFTSSSIDALEAIADRFLVRRELKWVVFEISDPQNSNPPTPWNNTGRDSESPALEARLVRFLEHVRFVRHRAAFVSDNLARLPALLVFAPALGGWEVKGSDQLASWLGHAEAAVEGFRTAEWQPRIFRGEDPTASLNAEVSALADRYAAIARRYRNRGVRVAFASPPLGQDWTPAPERNELKSLFAEVARRSGCEVWDYSSLVLAPGYFRNPSHLGRVGRAHYSHALGHEAARLFRIH